ncbi:hypothetical protein L873DRAFT_1795639 [Choiromyces venosus 120613-1]|uniref:DUF4219 domain-containing protein n=1 Tax=Choiromyces venosus 120613-1 TaxID=1336337 RepID=A0A3N4J0V3_9PEZI|nr:hypothetical protein L873DRAFT_1795639 [Choiromyces venosus 120613-1]
MTAYYPAELFPCPQLTYGTDFYLWKMHMEVHLYGLGLWDIVSGKEKPPDPNGPTPAPSVSEETKKKRAAWALILQSMTDPLFVKYFRSSDPERCPAKLWAKVREDMTGEKEAEVIRTPAYDYDTGVIPDGGSAGPRVGRTGIAIVEPVVARTGFAQVMNFNENQNRNRNRNRNRRTRGGARARDGVDYVF